MVGRTSAQGLGKRMCWFGEGGRVIVPRYQVLDRSWKSNGTETWWGACGAACLTPLKYE
jgi:hypothetical protein